MVNFHSRSKTMIFGPDEDELEALWASSPSIAHKGTIDECGFYKNSCTKCLHFLQKSLSIIENCLPNGHGNILCAGCEFEKMVAAGYISPKLYQFFKLIHSFGGATKVLCIISVEKTITAKVLDMILKGVADLSHFEAAYLTGNATSFDAMSAMLWKGILQSFRSRKLLLSCFI